MYEVDHVNAALPVILAAAEEAERRLGERAVGTILFLWLRWIRTDETLNRTVAASERLRVERDSWRQRTDELLRGLGEEIELGRLLEEAPELPAGLGGRTRRDVLRRAGLAAAALADQALNRGDRFRTLNRALERAGVAKDTLEKKGLVPGFCAAFVRVEVDVETGRDANV